VSVVDASGVGREEPLAGCWNTAFEQVLPVRRFPSFKGQRNFPGWWWSCKTGRHVGHESWLERDHAMLLDFDEQVVAFSSQPFRLSWPDEAGWRSHVPDFFARLADGSGMVLDIRADDRIEPSDAEAFAATRDACTEVGWSFRRVGVVDPVFLGNVRWLSRYRHPRCGRRHEVADHLVEAFAEPAPLLEGAGRVGDPLGVLPVLYHLIWRGVLRADLDSAVLSSSSVVVARDGER